MKFSSSIILLPTFVLALSGCAKSPDSMLPAAAPGGHAHTAPHGGTLVELGDHGYSLELVRDADAGILYAYVLDGHAENFVRIAASSFELIAIAGGERRPLTLRAVANSATGETVGDTSQFEAQADWLRRDSDFPGTIPMIDIRGTTFRDVALYFQK
jgi:hypothetical protein